MEKTNATRYRIQCGRLNSSWTVLRAERREEDEILSGSAAARTVTGDVGDSPGSNERKRRPAAGRQDLRTRGRGSALERRLHDRPWPKPMRRAHVDLW